MRNVILAVSILALTVSSAWAQTDPRTRPLVQATDLAYLGSFTVPTTDGTGRPDTVAGLTYGSGALGLGADGASLYFGCVYNASLSRISIPALGGAASIVDPCVAVPNLAKINPTDPNRQHVGGSLWWGGRLIASAYSSYDGAGTASASHFAGATVGSLAGPYRVGSDRPGLLGGYMGVIPTEWRALLGGPVLTGQCCISIISRSSYGPAASVFDPATLGSGAETSTLLVGYPTEHQTLGNPDVQNPYFTWATRMGGVAFPSGTRSVLFIGRHGGTSCYGQGTANQALDQQPVPGAAGVRYCYDPLDGDKGTHGYPYRHQVWAYDASDLAAVKAGTKAAWDLTPYATWTLNDMASNGAATIGSAVYDDTTRKLYVVEDRGGAQPRVHVYRIGAGSAPPTPPAAVDCAGTWGQWTRQPNSESACSAAGSRTFIESRLFTVSTPPANGGAACPTSPESRTSTEPCSAPVVTVQYQCWVTSVLSSYADGDAKRQIRCDTNGPIPDLPNGTTFTVTVPKK